MTLMSLWSCLVTCSSGVSSALHHDRDARQRRVLGGADRERVDVEAAPREQRRDAREHAGLVLHEHGERVLHHSHTSSRSSSSSISETGPAGDAAEHLVDRAAGRHHRETFSSRSTRQSTSAGPSWSNAASSASSTSSGFVTRSAVPAVRLGELHEVRACPGRAPMRRSACRRTAPATAAPCRGSRC